MRSTAAGSPRTGARRTSGVLSGLAQTFCWPRQRRQHHVRNADVRGGGIADCRLRGVDIWNVEIHGELKNVIISGVDVAPLIQAKLNRREPDRGEDEPDTPDGFRDAVLEERWAATVERARTFTEEQLHQEVGGEWSFIQTLRHLCFATDAWVGADGARRAFAVAPPRPAVGRGAGVGRHPVGSRRHPGFAEVLAGADAGRRWSAGSSPSSPDRSSTQGHAARAGVAAGRGLPAPRCLQIVLNEEWEHRQYAERDLNGLA